MRQMIPAAAAQTRSVIAAVVLGTALSASNTQAESIPTRDVPSSEASGEEIRAVTRYCQVCWRNARLPIDLWTDCTQQVFVRLLERVPSSQWVAMLNTEGEDKREFLRAIDTVKKRAQRTKKYQDLPTDVSDVQIRGFGQSREQWEAVNRAAEELLSARQKKIVELSANGWAVPEIANELNTTPERISDEKYKAIRKLRSELNPGV